MVLSEAGRGNSMTEAEQRKPEIERRFELAAVPSQFADCEFEDIEQGYLPDGTRLRKTTKQDGTTHYSRIRKEGEGLMREEVGDFDVSAQDFEKEWDATNGKRIAKRRIIVPGNENVLVFHIDVFKGPLEGHIIVEPEFESIEKAEKFEAPEWLRKCKELTNLRGYSNKKLAEFGWPQEDIPKKSPI